MRSRRRQTGQLQVLAAAGLAAASALAQSSEFEAKPEGPNPAWVLERPPGWTQVEKPDTARGGINPCLTPDPGFNEYRRWKSLPGFGQVLLPKQLVLGQNAEFDLWVHFHGAEPMRKEWVQVMSRAVLVAVDIGIGSGSYFQGFEAAASFLALLSDAEREVERVLNVEEARVHRVGLSAWSAGYGAVSRVLSQAVHERVRDVVVLDGIHTGYWGPNLNSQRIETFANFAAMAAAGDRFMFVSHSSVIPPGYASTTETANFLVWRLGGKPQPASKRSTDPLGLELISTYSNGGFHMRGFSGGGAKDHCAQLGLLRDVLKTYVKPRWEPG